MGEPRTFYTKFALAFMRVTHTTQSNLNTIDFNKLEFGKVFTDYMLYCDFDGEKWGEFTMEPLQALSFHPATSVLHYGQAIFEGLKAYRAEDDKINIFRLRDNILRMNKSAERMAMPDLEVESVVHAIQEFVKLQKDWVPSKKQGSLYIRPFMISTDNTLRAIPSNSFRFMVIACPVGFYYSTAISLLLEKSYSRAATGGVGYAKAAGNYAASFYPSHKAKEKGFDQILWTDVNNNNTLEELGSANFFFVKEGVLYTPEIHDSILEGITRDTVIKLAQMSGIEVVEKQVPADEFEGALKNGKIDCMFATGTAAGITFVNSVSIDETLYSVDSDRYAQVLTLLDALNAVKTLQDVKNPDWNFVV